MEDINKNGGTVEKATEAIVVSKQKDDRANTKLALKMLWVVAGSLLFAFALVPLYDVFCDLTGLNGKTENSAATLAKAKVDTSRMVTVQFVACLLYTSRCV